MRESRLFRIVYYLLQNGKATAPELAQKFEVSIRTIYRDIDSISSAGIPIYATQGKGGGISILNDYTLDKSLFSEQEQELMLTALQGMVATTEKNSNELLIKLSGLFQINSTNWIEVDFSDWAHRTPQQDTFNIIKEAIFQKRVISFCYFSGKGNKEKRNVRPIRLVFKSKSWYLYSFCRRLLLSRHALIAAKRMTVLQKSLNVYMICSLYASVQGINASPFLPHRAVHGL